MSARTRKNNPRRKLKNPAAKRENLTALIADASRVAADQVILAAVRGMTFEEKVFAGAILSSLIRPLLKKIRIDDQQPAESQIERALDIVYGPPTRIEGEYEEMR